MKGYTICTNIKESFPFLRAIQPGCASSQVFYHTKDCEDTMAKILSDDFQYVMISAQGSCLAGLTHLGAALLVLLGFALVLLAYKVVSTHVTTSELGWGRSTYLLSYSPGGQEKC